MALPAMASPSGWSKLRPQPLLLLGWRKQPPHGDPVRSSWGPTAPTGT